MSDGVSQRVLLQLFGWGFMKDEEKLLELLRDTNAALIHLMAQMKHARAVIAKSLGESIVADVAEQSRDTQERADQN